MRGGIILLGVLGLAAAPVAAEPPPRSMAERFADKLTEVGDAVDGHLGLLTGDRLDLRIDGRARRAHLRLRGGQRRYLAFRLDGEVHLEHGAAVIDARLELGIAGRPLTLELPDLELVPRSFAGERYLEVRLPLLGGRW